VRDLSTAVHERARALYEECATDPRERLHAPAKQHGTGRVLAKPGERELRAAALYLATIQTGERVTQDDVAASTGISTRALRQAYSYVLGVCVLGRIA
jgi:transcription initiation factor TFIIIB Brf1 subunit/transcription initiation factor TFIIB